MTDGPAADPHGLMMYDNIIHGDSVLFVVQVLNRNKLQRAGEDNLFVRLLYAKDKAQTPKNQDEQEKLGMPTDLPSQPLSGPSPTTRLTCPTYSTRLNLIDIDLPVVRRMTRDMSQFASGPILCFADIW